MSNVVVLRQSEEKNQTANQLIDELLILSCQKWPSTVVNDRMLALQNTHQKTDIKADYVFVGLLCLESTVSDHVFLALHNLGLCSLVPVYFFIGHPVFANVLEQTHFQDTCKKKLAALGSLTQEFIFVEDVAHASSNASFQEARTKMKQWLACD